MLFDRIVEKAAEEPWIQPCAPEVLQQAPPGEIAIAVCDPGAENVWLWLAKADHLAERLELPPDLREAEVQTLVDWIFKLGRLHLERFSLRRLIDRFEERIKRDSGRVRMADLLQEANQRLQEQSVRDGLTGIPNRRRFEEHFDFLWGRAAGEEVPIALILSDIDFFKKLNDSLGHQEGDRCLQEVAHKLRTLVEGEDDLVARFGGEEFVILLWNADRARASQVAESLRVGIRDLAIEHPLHPAGRVTISLGVACAIPSLTSSAEDFLHQADSLLYQAKSLGRDRWEIDPKEAAT